jgi:exonuclease III
MCDYNINFMSWNPRGLNCPKRRDVVSDLLASTSCQIVCLQETKLQNVDSFTTAHLGGHRLRQFSQRPTDGTKGDILMLWDNSVIQVANVVITTFSLSATITIIGTNISFKLTTVYGPTRGNLKDAFFLWSWWRRNCWSLS